MAAIIRTKIQVEGMTCPACERSIQRSLIKTEGIREVLASYATGKVIIQYDDDKVNETAIRQQLTDIGYPPAVPLTLQQKIKSWLRSLVVLIGIVAAFFIGDRLGIFNMFPVAREDTPLSFLFVVGLFTSVHCIAMCGGINLSQTAVKASPESGTLVRILPSLLYNGGRVISYTVVGGLVGAIGSVVTPSGAFKGSVAIVAGVFMLIMGLNMLGVFPVLRRLQLRLPGAVTDQAEKSSYGKGPFVVGLLNGFIPCGPLQAMQLYALSTGSFFKGALSMFLFSLGTVPLMFFLGVMSAYLNEKFQTVMVRVSGVLVIFLAVMMLNNGLALSGFQTIF